MPYPVSYLSIKDNPLLKMRSVKNVHTERSVDRNVAGIQFPDTAMAMECEALVRKGQPQMLLRHGARVFVFAALLGFKNKLDFNQELLYVSSMLHDFGLTRAFRKSNNRYEIDGANFARIFLEGYNIAKTDSDSVWEAIALHTTPGISEHKGVIPLLLRAGFEVDVIGAGLNDFSVEQRATIIKAFPRERTFKQKFIDAYAQGMSSKPHTTYGTVNADLLERADPSFRRKNFCGMILGSDWID